MDAAITTTISPRRQAALYFMSLGILAHLFIQSLLFALGLNDLVPFFPGLVLSILCSSMVGALFGPRILGLPSPYRLKAFLYGILMMLVALAVFNLGLLMLLDPYYPDLLPYAENLKTYAIIYGLMFIYSFLSVGGLLCVACGVASLYFRRNYAEPHVTHPAKP